MAERRLKALYDTLPDGARVSFDRAAIGSMLGLEESRLEPAGDLTTNAASDMFGVKPGTILEWLHAGRFGGEGTGWYRLGKRYYIRPSALDDLANNSAKRATGSFSLSRR